MSYFHIELDLFFYKKPRNHYGRFLIEPLKQGQGITIGNALRRTLLTDLTGTAIVAIRIVGIDHEFTCIPGVREDVLEILLNLKQIIFKSNITEPQIGRVKVQGPAVVTAGLFELPSEIGIVDPSQYIATICNNTIFEMEFRIEQGQAYRIVEKGIDNTFADFLPIDAIFAPVMQANYEVEEIRVKKLMIEIWTNGSCSPEEALSKASNILSQIFYTLKNLKYVQKVKYVKINQISIEELQLSVRAYNCLKRAKIHFISDLLEYNYEDLLEIKNFGQKSADEVMAALSDRFGINLNRKTLI
uniref:RNA polymerase alpha subunit n=1 Tax=Glaucosphaera vacuolata TaxID=38265 RepID=UPI001FCD5B8A|nr:RNA polymerase alpha subunit [Glaucosphaera vacuolata]UNJ18608.1 RNA polymerase alpha subunit [Glaucosphaera vacuolata]